MSKKTIYYKMNYLERGFSYGATQDYRRFSTLEYNLESYIGIVGVGVIGGWQIEENGGLSVKILPGRGIIDGYFVESPYVAKLRSVINVGDREIETLTESVTLLKDVDTYIYPTGDTAGHYHYITDLDGFDNGNLGISIGSGDSHAHSIVNDVVSVVLGHSHTLFKEKWNYVNAILDYDPTYIAPEDIYDNQIKVVEMTSADNIISGLDDNSDNYIFAKRLSSTKPYPLLVGMPPPAGDPPNINDYPLYADYLIAKSVYDAKLAALRAYDWQLYAANHFTSVTFVSKPNNPVVSDSILIGKVTTRNGEVFKIDTSLVDSLENMGSKLKSYARDYLVGHNHGGSQEWDPAKVRLETDIREASLYGYNEASKVTTYDVLEKDISSITIGHKHHYSVDSEGNGITIDIVGSSTPIHYHNIEAWVVQTQLGNTFYVEDHIHTVQSSSTLKGDTWTSDSRYNIYVDDLFYADETSDKVTVDSSAKKIRFLDGNGVGNAYNTYYCSFPVYGTVYTYEKQASSVWNYMLGMVFDFNNKFSYKYEIQLTTFISSVDGSETEGTANGAEVEAALAENPFNFYDSEGNIAGTEDLRNQSTAAGAMLKEEGDQFIFTPDAAKNITVTLKYKGNSSKVSIEILGNVEVHGVLGEENITYVNANKFLLGELSIERIPFISHSGRMADSFLPFKCSMASIDGVRYLIVPSITDTAIEHSHKLQLDYAGDGYTSDLIVDGQSVVYGFDDSGKSYYIYHSHAVENYLVESSNTEGLMEWYNITTSSNVDSAIHTHDIIYPVVGNYKNIYSIRDDIDGNMYVGTSDGFMLVPSTPSYLFVINTHKYYYYGVVLWDLFDLARKQYEKDTGDVIDVGSGYYSEEIANAESVLLEDGDSYLIYDNNNPSVEPDKIMIKRLSCFDFPIMKYAIMKKESEVTSEETIIEVIEESVSSGEVVSENSIKDPYVVVERNFGNVPIWSFDINTPSLGVTNIVVAGSNVISSNSNISNNNHYNLWSGASFPFFTGIIRKIIRTSSGEYWLNTNNGLLVSRDYDNGNAFVNVSLPGGNPNILDIIELAVGEIYVVSSSGLFMTSDGGGSWSKIFDVVGGFVQITRDNSLDKTNIVNDHYHTYMVNIEGNGFLSQSIGVGASHNHIVTSWEIQDELSHSHDLVATVYLLDTYGWVWLSKDGSTSWEKYVQLSFEDHGDISAYFGTLMVSAQDGIYRLGYKNVWSKVLDFPFLSSSWDYTMSSVLLGCGNAVYSMSDDLSFSKLYQFSGSASPILYKDSVKKAWGYAFNNDSETFHFKDVLIPTEEIAALVDCNSWFSSVGEWGVLDLYDIYVDNKLVLSTKSEVDNRDSSGIYFEVEPSNGLINFGFTTKLSNDVSYYSDIISVENTEGFNIGDEIAVYMANSTYHTSIDNIDNGYLSLSSRLEDNLETGMKVEKIADVNANTEIFLNIYGNSILSNIGQNTHEDLEDKLSMYSDGRPYKFNDTYLSNLLQLTQAVRYVYPGINEYFKSSLFYDFRYSTSESDPVYPPIQNYIDILTTDIYSQKVYDSNFEGRIASSINRLLIGWGDFDGKAFAATDIGVFWCEIGSDFENSWNYIESLPYVTHDIIIYGDGALLAATENGTYRTHDLTEWIKDPAASMQFQSYCFGLRWDAAETVTVPYHNARFKNVSTIVPVSNGNSITVVEGHIIAVSGTPYSVLQENRGIKVYLPDEEDEKAGGYIIQSITDNGDGYGSEMIVSPAFVGEDADKTDVQIVLGTWWGQWDGDVNTSNPKITNTLMVGGQNAICYNDSGVSEWTWKGSSFPIYNFLVKDFLSLSGGSALAATVGNDSANQSNYILKAADVGATFETARSFLEVRGSITSFSLTEFNHTEIEVTYADVEYRTVDNSMDQCSIAIYKGVEHVYGGKILNNVAGDSQTIVVYGNELGSSVLNDSDVFTFRVLPVKINSMLETNSRSVMFGTDIGMYYDKNSFANPVVSYGTVNGVGVNASISSIDINGFILSVNSSSVGNSIITVNILDIVVRENELVGKTLYITDLMTVEKYPVVKNSSYAVGGENTIEIEGLIPAGYKNKRFVVAGETSTIYVSFDLPIKRGGLSGGVFYVTTQDENNNYASKYEIVNNSSNSIDLKTQLQPQSTMSAKSSDLTIASIETKQDLQVGQDIMCFDSGGKLEVWVVLDEDFKDNALAGLTFRLVKSGALATQIDTESTDVATTRDEDAAVRVFRNLPIDSNFKNGILLDVGELIKSGDIDIERLLQIKTGDSFEIHGGLFEAMLSFGHKTTSTDVSHYHAVDNVNAIVSGKVSVINNYDASFVEFDVSDAVNFDLELVQRNGDLFYGAKIVFTNLDTPNIRCVSEVIMHTSNSITVKTKSLTYWGLSGYDKLRISDGWDWTIDASAYGYTGDPIYDDFMILSRKAIDNFEVGSEYLEIESTAGILVGDKISIQDDTLSSEIHHVAQILSATRLEITSSMSRTYFKNRNVQIKVLRDVFSNIQAIHTHQIRNNEVQTVIVREYLDHGYNSEHSHRSLPLISDVSALIDDGKEIFSVGSSSIMYSSRDNGGSWRAVVDFNLIRENEAEISGISAAAMKNGKFAIGTTNGNVFVRGVS